MKKSSTIFLVGPEGAGKSTVGIEIAEKMNMKFYDTDLIIAERAGVTISWIYDVEGESGYRQREKKIIAEFAKLPNIVLATGGGAVMLAENRTLLAQKGWVVYIKATIEQQLDRTHRKEHRPALRVDNVVAQLERMKEERANLYETIADLTVETHGQSVRYVAQEICDQLITHGYPHEK